MSDWVFCVVDMTRESLVPVNTDMLDRVTYIRFWLLDQYLYYPFKETGDDQRRLFRTPQSDKSKTYNSHLDVLKYVISISTLKLKLLRPCADGLECRGTTVDASNASNVVHHDPKCLPIEAY